MSEMTGKTVLVTGATSGIGQEMARSLAASGAHVFVHGRDPVKGAAVVGAIKTATGNERVESVSADFAQLSQVRALAQEMLRRATRLDVLINNAGRGQLQRKLTADGFEETFAVNHLAPFLLTNLLLPRLKESAPARIVIVASSSHHRGRIDFDNLNAERGYQVYRAYSQSKLANLLFMRALMPRLGGTGVTVNALHPGVVRTGIGMDRLPFFARGLAHVFVHPFLLSAKQGAQTGIYLARAPEVENTSGRYFIKCEPAPQASHAEDDAMAEKLWMVSEKMCGLAS